MSKLIEILAPRQSWVDDFLRLKQTIMRAAPAGAYLHHIGSTAVPGLAAKDITDIQVTVDDLAQIDGAAFEREGFKCRPGLVDHCPPGLELAESELRKLFFRGSGRPANVHIREKGRFNQRFALLCRYFLRAHPTAASAYALIKQRLAERFPTDADAYYDIKDPVFDIIMDGANEWAKVIGWSEPPGD
ncbi:MULTISPECIES: GrpB family protein [unclassified Sinorhizobium]|uniref:GrpB family protein n=1 Tax=unclassified Sinorhizobium TaxID=2613772 RepID=UPI003523B755